MAGSLLILLDDIASVLDDVALLTKVASRKAATLAGDDLAVGAHQVTGVSANRELPVVWRVFKGSLLNKAILVPLALLLSSFAPWAITPLLILGGSFLCFEGGEKLLHHVQARRNGHAAEEVPTEEERAQALLDAEADPQALERQKVSGAVRTDFILSAEIVIISLGTMENEPLLMQVLALSTIALLMTVLIYGVVAMIVKIDDLGLYLQRKASSLLQALGRGLIAGAPWLMRLLSVAGTLAMFLVGGSILAHAWPALAHRIEHSGTLAALGMEMAVGLVVGLVLAGLWMLVEKLRHPAAPAA